MRCPKRISKGIVAGFFIVLSLLLLWLHFDSYQHSRTLLLRRPQHEVWFTSERYRIQVLYEHPGRADESFSQASSEACRDLTGTNQMSAIGFFDDTAIPLYYCTWGRPTPAHMRPANQYSLFVPHGLLILIFVSTACVFAVHGKFSLRTTRQHIRRA